MPPVRDSLWSPAHRALTLGLVLTITLVAAEALALGAAMPLVARDLGRLDLYGWVFSAFFVGSLVGITIVGGVIDRRGIVVPFLVGTGLFIVGLVIGGLAPSMEVLVGARFVQGLGGGAVPPIAYVAIGRGLPERLRPSMFAALSTAWVVPGIAGPGIGGLVAETVGWRWVFLGLVPLVLVAGSIAFRALRTTSGAGSSSADFHGTTAEAHPAADGGEVQPDDGGRRRLVDALLVGAGAVGLVGGLAATDGASMAVLLMVGVVLAVPALLRLCPPGTLVAARGYPTAILLRGVISAAFFAVDAYIALLLVEVRGWSAAGAGLALTAATLSWTLGAWIQARWSRRIEAERFAAVGFLLVSIGLAAIAPALIPTVPAWLAIPPFIVAGLGMGLAYSQFAIIVLRAASAATQGAATSALSLIDGLGAALGTGVATAFVAASVRAGDGAGPGLGWVIAFGAMLAALGFVLSSRLRPAARLQTASS